MKKKNTPTLVGIAFSVVVLFAFILIFTRIFPVKPDSFWEAVAYELSLHFTTFIVSLCFAIGTWFKWREWLKKKRWLYVLSPLLFVIMLFISARSVALTLIGASIGPEKKVLEFYYYQRERGRYHNYEWHLYFLNGEKYHYRDPASYPMSAIRYGTDVEIQYVPIINRIYKIQLSE